MSGENWTNKKGKVLSKQRYRSHFYPLEAGPGVRSCCLLVCFISAIRTTENAIKSGGWMVMDAAETLFASAKSRVFPSENKFEFEEVPKWKILKEIIDEIKQENKDDSITLGM